MNLTALYFFLAVLPVFIAADKPPADGWGWFKLGASALYAGLLSVKALQSTPPGEPVGHVPPVIAALAIAALLVTGCAGAKLPPGSYAEARTGFSKDSGPSGKLLIHVPLGEHRLPPGFTEPKPRIATR